MVFNFTKALGRKDNASNRAQGGSISSPTSNHSGRTSTDNNAEEDARPGKFPELRGFIQPNSTHQPDHKLIDQIDIQPGHVIHIFDSRANLVSSRLHQRVMLVIHVNPQRMVCYPLERHDTLALREDHWHVRALGVGETAHAPADLSDNRPALHIDFKEPLDVDPGLTVKLADAWHVELHQPKFEVLGYAETESWNAAIEESKMLCSNALENVKRVPPGASLPTPQTSVSPPPRPPVIHHEGRREQQAPDAGATSSPIVEVGASPKRRRSTRSADAMRGVNPKERYQWRKRYR